MQAEDAQQGTSQSTNALEGWTKSDKYDLLQSIKENGSHNISSIIADLPNKTTDQIIAALDYYKEKAFNPPGTKTNCYRFKSDVSYKSSVPLFNWAKLLTDSFTFEELQTEIATALRLIGEFEDIPPPLCLDGIDFKKIYFLLANAVEGKALEEDNYSQLILHKCVLDTAINTRSFMRISNLNQVLDDVDVKNNGPAYTRIIPKDETGVIMQLAMQKNYNPLNIPLEYLKPSEV